MDSKKIEKAISLFPVDQNGNLAIPPSEDPVYLYGDDVEVKSVLSSKIPNDSTDFFKKFFSSSSVLAAGLPVVVALSRDKIFFWSHLIDAISGVPKSVPGKISIESYGLFQTTGADSGFLSAIAWFHSERHGIYGISVYAVTAAFGVQYSFSSNDKVKIVLFAQELLRRSNVKQDFNWDLDWQVLNLI
ncbi:hypothetical protein AGMMS49983_01310 [Clostridia bacterium]|nr:hypothetical protein AGMMS49983_01310 [Clostridia bacterium]